ncbi:MAG: bifunctional oligoribonuclease/PAP phosphatase NrnA [Candidatus Dojkabacteria bacterium]|nr:MAG: bifunctional oligoribonuclease/PAP phosphatase NrnA [Candidatus Dojkabacteria bacterium]
MSEEIKNIAPQILNAIQNSSNILLHCHPHPDPDSVSSALAMQKMLQQLGKRVTTITGDSKIPVKLSEIPNIQALVQKNYSEVNSSDFDLFIILDSSSLTQISQINEVTFPETMATIVIDHHATNTKFGNINLVEKAYSSTAEILYDLFTLWNWSIDSDTALCLFIGIFGDTGGFKYLNTSPHTFEAAAKLTAINPQYHKLAFSLENNKSAEDIELMGVALSSLDKYMNDSIVFSSISFEEFSKRNVPKEKATKGLVGDTLRSVVGWNVVASLVEYEPHTVMVSLRTRNEEKYDMSLIAKSVGVDGGGHKGAAGTTINKPLAEAKQDLLNTILEKFPSLNAS